MPEVVVSLSDVVGRGYHEFWESKHRYRVSIGGRGSKKSKTAALWYITNMMQYEGANLLVIRKVYKDHKDSTYTELKWAIRRLGVEALWEAKLNPLEITYKPTGQKILFRGLDDPMSITSITVEYGHLCWCWIEEAFQVTSEQDFNLVDGSIRGVMPEHLFKQITMTMNPWNERHWIKKRFFDNRDLDTFTLQTTYMCNEFLDKKDHLFFENMKKANPRRYHVEGLGNWGVQEGLVFTNWEELEFDHREVLKKDKTFHACFGLDFGYTNDPTGFIAFLISPQLREIYVFDEHYEKGMLNNEIANMIITKGYGKEKIIADSSEPKSIAEIKGYGVPRIRGARKGNDSIANGLHFLLQFKMYVKPSLTNLILELNNYAFAVKDGKATSNVIDDYNHLIDPLRYGSEEFSKGSSIRFFHGRKH